MSRLQELFSRLSQVVSGHICLVGDMLRDTVCSGAPRVDQVGNVQTISLSPKRSCPLRRR